MVPAKTRTEPDTRSFSSDILQLLASSNTPLDSIQQVLQLTLEHTNANSVSFVHFQNTAHSVSVGSSDVWEGREKSLYDAVKDLPEQVCLNPEFADKTGLDKEWLAFPIRHAGEAVGALSLTFNSMTPVSEQEDELITSAAAAVKIVIGNIKPQAMSRDISYSIFGSITDPILAWDANLEVLFLNPAGENLFGVSDKESHGKKLVEVIQSNELMAQITDGKALNEWVSNTRAFIPRTEAVRTANGAVLGGFLILQDISRFKKLTRNQSEFMRIVSHDLRSPLTSMQGFANMLELDMVGALNEKQAHFVSKILSGITQMTGLVENIQDAGRYDPESGFYELNRSHTDLYEMANRIVENPLIPADKTLTLSVDVADSVPIIYADASMIERAIINLVDNAIKYTPNEGEIKLGVKVADNTILVSVQDNGLGIGEEDQKQLFQRHVRIARQEYKKIKGSGLGLFIVRSVAQRHGGDAWVESKLGEGSTFYFSIPLSDDNLVGSASE